MIFIAKIICPAYVIEMKSFIGLMDIFIFSKAYTLVVHKYDYVFYKIKGGPPSIKVIKFWIIFFRNGDK